MAPCVSSAPSAGAFDQPRAATGDRLLPRAGAMTVRVRGPGETGRLIQIRSPKCTIGSAPGCTLRLRAAGVGPLHCWILRGPGGAVVRRLDHVAVVNGRSLDEALLKSGDRLQIGSVELELVALGQEATVRDHVEQPAAIAPLSAHTAELEARLAAALDQLHRLESEARQGFQASITAAERADQLRDALAAADQQLDDSSTELAAAQQTITQQLTELDALRRQLSNQQALSSQIEEARRQSESQLTVQSRLEEELAQSRAVLDAERAAWQGERVLLAQRLSQRDAELEAVRSASQAQSCVMTVPLGGAPLPEPQADGRSEELQQQLAELQSQLDALRGQLSDQASLQARCDQLARDFEHKCNELAELQGREEAAARRLQSQEELEERTQALDRWQAELTQRTATVTASEQALQEQRQAADRERSEIEAAQHRQAGERGELAAQAELISTQSADLEAQRARLSGDQSEYSQRAAQLSQTQQQLEADRQQLDQRAAELAARQVQLDEQSAQLASREQALLASASQPPAESHVAAEVDRQSATAADSPAGSALATENGASEPGENPRDSSSVDSVLSRLVKAGLWRKDEQPGDVADADAASEQAIPSATLVVPIASSDGAAAPEPARMTAAVAAGHDDEESIDSYMQRLMQRVRGDSADAPQRGQAAPRSWEPAPPAPPVEVPAVTPQVVPAVSETVDPSQYVPRSTAPELGSNLTAMRELANTAARSAIDQHVRKRTHQQAATRLIVACLCLAASLFVAFWAWRTSSLPAAAGAALAGLLASSWLIASVRRVAKVRQVSQLNGAAGATGFPAEVRASAVTPDGK